MGFLPSGVRDLKFKHRFKYCICNKIMRHENLEHSLTFIGVHWSMQRVSDVGKPLWMPKLCVQTNEKEFRKNLINSNLGE